MGHAASPAPDTTATAKPLREAASAQAGRGDKAVSGLDRFMEMRGSDRMREETSRRSNSTHRHGFFSYALRLDADRPLVLQGDAGYRRNRSADRPRIFHQPISKRPAASPSTTILTRSRAWPGGSGVEQPAARFGSKTGWDWLSLHLTSGEKLMLYRLRQKDGHNDLYGN